MGVKSVRRGPHRTTVLLVAGVVGAMLIGTAGAAVGASLITSAQIKNGTIRAVDIKNNAITGKKIRNGTIKSKDVKNGSLTTKDVKNGSLTGDDIKASSLTGGLVEDGSLTGDDIKASSLTGALVEDGSLTGDDLAAESIAGQHLATGSVERKHLAPDLRPYWAVVEVNGTLARGSADTTSTLAYAGTYHVSFPVDVNECAFSATIGNSVNGTPAAGLITATPLAANTKAVYVKTYDSNVAISNRPFHLVVHC